jgi:hypothetical protein
MCRLLVRDTDCKSVDERVPTRAGGSHRREGLAPDLLAALVILGELDEIA